MKKKAKYHAGQVVTLEASPKSGPYKGHNWPEAIVKVVRDGPDENGRVEIQYSSRRSLDRDDDGLRLVPSTEIRPGRP